MVLGAACACTYFGPHVIRALQVAHLRRLCRETASLVLTYDDGPGEELTPALLDLLAAAGVRTTFFPTGRSATRKPDLLGHVAAAGHEIGCHSQNHLHAWRRSPWAILRDIRVGYRTLAPWISANGLYRPPYGKATLATWWAVLSRGAGFAWWTVDSGDTHAVLPEPQDVVERVRRDGGAVVLMHDFGRTGPERSARHVFVLGTTRLLLKHAKTSGLSVITMGELLQHAHEGLTEAPGSSGSAPNLSLPSAAPRTAWRGELTLNHHTHRST